MSSEHTHTKRVCKFIPLRRTGSVGPNRFPDATSSCFVALSQFSAAFFFVGGKHPPHLLTCFFVTGCIDLLLLPPYLTHARPSLEP